MKEDRLKIEGWGKLQQLIENEERFYKVAILHEGYMWDDEWLEAYLRDDRGYEVAKRLCEVVFNDYVELEKYTSEAQGIIPAMEKELFVMSKLYEDFLKPVKEIIYTKVPSSVEKRGGKLILFPDEWIKISDSISRERIYMNYRRGYNLIRNWHFIRKKPIVELIRAYKNDLLAFERKWDEKYYTGGVDTFSFVTFCAIDSHDNTILPRLLKERQYKKILLNEIPEIGINKVVLAPNEDVKKKMDEILKIRAHKEALCTVNSLRMRLNREKVRNYITNLLELSGLLDKNLKLYIS